MSILAFTFLFGEHEVTDLTYQPILAQGALTVEKVLRSVCLAVVFLQYQQIKKNRIDLKTPSKLNALCSKDQMVFGITSTGTAGMVCFCQQGCEA